MLADSLNAVRWQGKGHRGIYEVFYITLVDPASGDAYWFRYTLDVPAEGIAEPEAGLWAVVTPKADPRSGLALHDKHPIARFQDKSSDEKGFRIELGKAFLDRNKAQGKVGTGERTVEWDLKWELNGIGFEHVSPLFETLKIAKASVNAAQLAIEVEGTIKVGGKAIKVTKWPGQQAHTWGSKHADQWAWAHTSAFAEDKTAVFEGFSARVRKLGMLLPAATPIFFRQGEETFTWSGATTIFANRSTFGEARWEFEAEGDTLLLRGIATAPAERIVSVEYRDPRDGEVCHCAHATSGDLVLEVYRRVGFRWELDRKLTAPGTTCFEVASRQPHVHAGRTLPLAQTRDASQDDAPKPAAAAPKPAPAKA